MTKNLHPDPLQTIPDAGPTAPATGFPLRVAALDVGSNAIRYVIADFADPHRFTEVETQRFAVRLGRNTFLSGQLDPQAMDGGVEAITHFRRRLDDLGIRDYRAVATSAVREGRNGGEFIDRVRRESGIRLETITGSEEARLVWLAIRDRIPLGDQRWMLVDLGGGSVEASLVDDAGILWSESHHMGSVRLLEEFSGAGTDAAHFRRLVEEYVSVLEVPVNPRHPPAGTIATGGNIETLARLAGREPDERGVSALPLVNLRSVAETLANLPYEERIRRFDLREDRADVIVPAAVVYERLAAMVGTDRILVPHVGVKEGVLIDLVDDLTAHEAHEGRPVRAIFAGTITLGRRYRFDEEHARHVADLSLSLFDQLTALHELGDADRRILLAAALLHDVGQFISCSEHHKHSWYLISHSELPDLAPLEIQLVALVARYHRRAEPGEEHDGYRELSEAERSRVRKLASLLRIADALDREHLQQVRSATTRIDGGELVLEIPRQGDLLLEQWSLQKKAEMFKHVFGLGVRIAMIPAGENG